MTLRWWFLLGSGVCAVGALVARHGKYVLEAFYTLSLVLWLAWLALLVASLCGVPV